MCWWRTSRIHYDRRLMIPNTCQTSRLPPEVDFDRKCRDVGASKTTKLPRSLINNNANDNIPVDDVSCLDTVSSLRQNGMTAIISLELHASHFRLILKSLSRQLLIALTVLIGLHVHFVLYDVFSHISEKFGLRFRPLKNVQGENVESLITNKPMLLTFGTLMQCDPRTPRNGQNPLSVRSKMADSAQVGQ